MLDFLVETFWVTCCFALLDDCGGRGCHWEYQWIL